MISPAAAMRLLNPTPSKTLGNPTPSGNMLIPGVFGGSIPDGMPGFGAPGQPGTSANTGASSPSGPIDFLSLIQGDPLYHQTTLDLNANSVSDAQTAAAAIVRSLIQRGIVPDVNAAAATLGLSPDALSFLKNNVDLSTAGDLAKKATDSGVSQEAQLAQQYNDSINNDKDNLAARGLAESGASSFLLGRDAQSDTQRRYAADQQTSDYINGAIAAFTNAERGRQSQLRQAAADAADRQRSLLGATTLPSGGSNQNSAPPPPPADTSDPFATIRDLLARASRTNKAIAV